MKFSTLVFLVINAIFFACLVSANPIAEDAGKLENLKALKQQPQQII